VLRFAVVISIPNKQVSDFRVFHELAVALSNGKGLVYDGPTGLSEDVALYRHHPGASGPLPTAFRMPGTPVIYASLYALFGPREIFPKLLNALLGAGIGICLLLLLWRRDPCRGFWAGLIWEIYPGSLFNTNLLGTEIHFTFGIVLAALLLTKLFINDGSTDKPGPGSFSNVILALAAGLGMGCTCLIRPSTQLLLCMIAVSLWYVGKSKANGASLKNALRLTLIMLFGIAVPLIAWGLRNYKTFGIFEAQSTEIGFNFLTMTQQIVSPREERSLDSLTNAFFRSRDEFQIALLAREIGLRRLGMAASHPAAFAKTLVKNFMRPWKSDTDGLSWCLLEGRGPSAANARVYMALTRIVQAGYLSLIALALMGIIGTSWREIRHPGVSMMLLYFLGTCLLLCIFQGQGRYHLPLMPFFCVLAAYCVGKSRATPFPVD
jgi:hypothetical protein